MIKIQSKEEKEKKETRKKLIMGIILVVIMVLSTAGYAFFSSPETSQDKIEYNGITFTLNENGLWQFRTNNLDFATQYNPTETENISVPIFMTANSYSGGSLFFVGKGAAKQEIAGNLLNLLSRIPQDACLEGYEDKCGENDPVKKCLGDNVIVIREANDTKISQEDKCIFIEAPYSEQVKAADALIFKILGIK